jgi:hypothetical protein
MNVPHPLPPPAPERVEKALGQFMAWLGGYGETSRDHQTFFAGIGGRAKELYYQHPRAGILAVAPLIACEAFLPSTRRFFHRDTRFPIADAHYAMGFAFLHEVTGEPAHLERAVHFLRELEQSRCAGYAEFCWGYPFDWVTRNGTITAQTPLITSTPYVYEAFLHVQALEPRDEWVRVLQSIAKHATTDIKDFRHSDAADTCSYTPFDQGGVINAAAYRAFLLTSAARVLGVGEYDRIARRNLAFVLETQNQDGSWFYAIDGVRDFVDHFHTCFVMKALAKIHALTGDADVLAALDRGWRYYVGHLFADDGLPRPFARAPRLTVYKRELYDCAECINLCLLLRDRFPDGERILATVVEGILGDWVKPDGSFRARKLFWGWDNVPMHRWAQSQMFRSLSFYLREARSAPADGIAVHRRPVLAPAVPSA